MAGVPTANNLYVSIYVDGKFVKQVRATTTAELFDEFYTVPQKSGYVIDKWYSSTAYVTQGNAVGDFWDGSSEYINVYARYVKIVSQPKAKLYIGDIEIECGYSYSKEEIDDMIGDIDTVLQNIING